MNNIKLYYSKPEFYEAAQEIASILPAVDCVIAENISEETYLCYEESGLVAYAPNFKPLNLVNFYREFISKRRLQVHREPILQALNYNKLKSHDNLTVLDMTGGLGRDSILFALAGISVTVIERNPYLACILNFLQLNFALELTELNVIHTDSTDYIKNTEQIYTCIYYDPMFEDNKHALSKKDMQLIDIFVHKSLSQANLVDNSEIYRCAKSICHKLIVKRDNKQETFIRDPKPTYQKIGKTIRFDVYQGDVKI